MTALHGDELLGLVDLASVIESTGDVCDVWSLPDCDSGGTAVDMLAPEALVDFCPKCQTTLQMRSLHGPAAGPIDGGWLCGRCGLQAVDLADARSYCCGYRPSAGLQWELMGIDYAHGRPVDRLAYAAAMGRYLLAEERSPYSHNTEHPIVDLLCDVSFGIAGGYGPSPWTDGNDWEVAEMVLAALNAGGCAVIDKHPERRRLRPGALGVLVGVIGELPAQRSDIDGARRILVALTEAGFELVEVRP